MDTAMSGRVATPAPDHLDCVVVFADGSTHFVRMTPHFFVQHFGTLAYQQAAAPVLDAMRRAFAAALEGGSDGR